MIAVLREAVLDALAVLLPVACAGCGRVDRAVCPACRAALSPHPIERVTPGGLPVAAGLAYAGVARRVVLALKEEGRTDAAPALAAALTTALERHPLGDLVLVPSAPASRRRRGFDPTAEIVRAAGLRATPALRSRSAAAQKTLGLEQRAANRAGAMRAVRPLAGRAVVLVDDIVTSGATLDEAARAVRAAGGTVLGAVAVASTARLLAAR
ncbi:phosphoribosyltransferase family protein [Galbitalea sp. SE-J8]|uniref:ComF family protein n=1 Tax=Galbitalea sp. SE-J8 TaxID=3054952 RepID=UPI00259D0A2D|nr:phosphoribosyltransferase family protein [Galbitalea sp. SE-J8]MDM4762702.1 phosphoribosyltransferase family protein [Galbitalea sp. SE-J8]